MHRYLICVAAVGWITGRRAKEAFGFVSVGLSYTLSHPTAVCLDVRQQTVARDSDDGKKSMGHFNCFGTLKNRKRARLAPGQGHGFITSGWGGI